MPSDPSPELAIRIIVEDPLAGVSVALQRGRDAIALPTTTTSTHLAFDFSVRLGKPQANGQPTFLGPYTQGPPATRFVYITIGRRAGQPTSPWDRRAKVPLAGIPNALITAVLSTPGKRLAVRIPGCGVDGGPICATVRLAASAWEVIG